MTVHMVWYDPSLGNVTASYDSEPAAFEQALHDMELNVGREGIRIIGDDGEELWNRDRLLEALFRRNG